MTKKCEACGIKMNICHCFLEYTNFKNDLMEYTCLSCNKSYQRKLIYSYLIMEDITDAD